MLYFIYLYITVATEEYHWDDQGEQRLPFTVHSWQGSSYKVLLGTPE
jgi:hypothetical protein